MKILFVFKISGDQYNYVIYLHQSADLLTDVIYGRFEWMLKI